MFDINLGHVINDYGDYNNYSNSVWWIYFALKY